MDLSWSYLNLSPFIFVSFYVHTKYSKNHPIENIKIQQAGKANSHRNDLQQQLNIILQYGKTVLQGYFIRLYQFGLGEWQQHICYDIFIIDLSDNYLLKLKKTETINKKWLPINLFFQWPNHCLNNLVISALARCTMWAAMICKCVTQQKIKKQQFWLLTMCSCSLRTTENTKHSLVPVSQM